MITKSKSEIPIKPLKNVNDYTSWQMPSLDMGNAPNFLQPVEEEEDPEISEEEKQKALAEELEAIKQSAKEKGFQAGREEGLAAARGELTQKSLLLTQMIEQLVEPTKVCEEITQQALLKLAFAVARQIVRRELQQDPTQLIAIIREALRKLPIGASSIVISLHPEDEAFVSSALSVSSDSEKKTWEIMSNPSIERGSCQVDTENSTVDASIDKQIAVLYRKFAGGQRAGESDVE